MQSGAWFLDDSLLVLPFENGFVFERSLQAQRRRFQKWLPTSFKLGLFTGLRLDELVHIKYSDIVEVDGYLILESINQKANNLIKDKKNKRIKRVPVTPELLKVLNEECDYDLHKNTDKYIIAPEMDGRSTVDGIITKGFTHFKRLAGIDNSKCFKELRTTYISALQNEFGDIILTSTVSDHSNKEVVKKHYLAQINAAKRCSNFSVFSNFQVSVNQRF